MYDTDKISQIISEDRGAYTPSTSAINTILKNVYLWMTLALLISGFTAMLVANSVAMITAIRSSSFTYIALILAQIGIVWYISAKIGQISFLNATILFIIYSILTGVTLSSIFLIFTLESIGAVFFITACTFGTLSIYGYVTKKDLSGWGSYLMMGLIGLIIASVVNLIIGSELLYWIVSYVGVLIFVGLTAYDTQKIKLLAYDFHSADEETRNKIALIGAVTLYLDFINLFLYILRIFGRRR